MMHVKLSPKRHLCYAAILAGISVPLTSKVALAFPSLAVIAVVSALPVVVLFAAMPLISALRRAKAESSCAYQGGRNDDVFTALFTIEFGRGQGGGLGGNKSHSPRLFVTGIRANGDVLGTYLKRLSFKRISANLTDKINGNAAALAAQFIRALAATGSLSTVFQPFGIGKICLLTVGATQLNHVHIIA